MTMTLSLTSLRLGSSGVLNDIARLVLSGLTSGFADDGDTLTASVSNPADGVVYTFRYDFPGGSSSGASYTVDFAGDSLSQGDAGTVVMLADSVEVASRDFTFGVAAITTPPATPAAPTFADTITDDTTPAILVGSGITDTIQLYIDGEPANATYDSGAGTLTPNGAMPVDTYDFTVTHENQFGESAQSPALSLQITNTPVLDFVGVTGPDASNDYDLQVLLSVPESVPSTLYIHVDLDTDPIPDAAAIIAGTGAVATFSEALTGDETNLALNMTGLAEVNHRLTAVVVVDANNDIASAIQSDTFTVPSSVAAAVAPIYLGSNNTTGQPALFDSFSDTLDLSLHNDADDIVVVFTSWAAPTPAITAVTLNGVAATESDFQATSATTSFVGYAVFAAADFPDTATFAITFDAELLFSFGVSAYAIPAGRTLTKTWQAKSFSPAVFTNNIAQDEGLIFAISQPQNGGEATLSGIPEDFEVETRTTDNVWHTVGSDLFDAAQTPLTITATNSASNSASGLFFVIGA